jgi:hypothetical protein
MVFRRFALRAAAAAAALLAAAALAGAQSVEVVAPLKAKTSATVPGGGRASVVGVLLPGGTTATGIQVKIVKGTKTAPNLLIPKVSLVYPDGTVKTQDDLLAAGAVVKANATSVNITKIPALPSSGLYKVLVTGANGLDGKPTVGTYTVKVAAKTPTGFKAVPGNISNAQPIDNYTVKMPEYGILSVTVKPTKLTPFGVTLKILSAAGDELDYSAFAKIGKDDSITVKNFPVPFFGDYTLRVGAAGGFGDYTILAKVKGKKPKALVGIPVADVDPLLVREPGTAGILDGSGSTGAVTYRWAQVTGPALTISNSKVASPTFTTPATRVTFGWQLTAYNNIGMSLPALVLLDVDRAPVANAGPGAAVDNGTQVTLDAGDSLDLDAGDVLRYAWSQVGGPTATLDDAFAEQPKFTPSSSGTYVFQLQVHDGYAASTDTVVVGSGGAAAVPDAGRPVIVRFQDSVFLSGLRSRSSVGGPPSTWAWTPDPANSVAVSLSGAGGPVASFTSPKQAARLRFRLVADGGSVQDEVTVVVTTATPLNGTPVAEAGSPQDVAHGDPFALDATGSTDDGTIQSYEWAQVAGEDSGLVPSGASADGTAADVDDVMQFLLMVHDGRKYGAPDGVTVVSGSPDIPVADAGSDQAAAAGGNIALTGTGSQPSNGGTISGYSWSQVSGLDWYDVAVEDPNWDPSAASPDFDVPANRASLTPTRAISFALVVYDENGASAADYVTATLTGLPKNSTPGVVADASGEAFRPGAAVTLFASASDPDGDPLTYSWVQTGGPTVALTAATTSQPTFNAPNATGTMTFQVTVNDGTGEPNSVSTDTTPVGVNQAPTVIVTATPASGPSNTLVTLDGSGTTDPSGETLSYLWVQTAPAVGGTVTLTNANTATCTFTQPAVPNNTPKPQRQRVFTLQVTDGLGPAYVTTATCTFVPNRPPVINAITASGDRKFKYDDVDSEILSITPAVDQDGDALTFAWRMVAGPPGNANPPSNYLSSSTGSTVTIKVKKPVPSANGTGGVYTVGVKASDGTEISGEATIQVLAYPSFQSHVIPIFQASCNSGACHGGSAGGLNLSSGAATVYSNLVNASGMSGSCSGGTRVAKNNYLGSCLYTLVNSGAMPQSSTALTQDLKNIIRDWIEPEYQYTNPNKPGLTTGAEFN